MSLLHMVSPIHEHRLRILLILCRRDDCFKKHTNSTAEIETTCRTTTQRVGSLPNPPATQMSDEILASGHTRTRLLEKLILRQQEGCYVCTYVMAADFAKPLTTWSALTSCFADMRGATDKERWLVSERARCLAGVERISLC